MRGETTSHNGEFQPVDRIVTLQYLPGGKTYSKLDPNEGFVARLECIIARDTLYSQNTAESSRGGTQVRECSTHQSHKKQPVMSPGSRCHLHAFADLNLVYNQGFSEYRVNKTKRPPGPNSRMQ